MIKYVLKKDLLWDGFIIGKEISWTISEDFETISICLVDEKRCITVPNFRLTEFVDQVTVQEDQKTPFTERQINDMSSFLQRPFVSAADVIQFMRSYWHKV